MKNLFRSAGLWLVLAFAAFFLGGCGSGGDSSDKVYVIGELHGALAEELESVCHPVSYDGYSLDGTIIVSDPQERNSWYSEENIAMMREAFADGQTVAIENGNQDEVNFFMDQLLSADDSETAKLDLEYHMPIGMTYVDFYGIKMLGDDVFAYIVLNNQELPPVVSDDLTAGFMVASGDSYVFPSQDITLNDYDRSFVVRSGDIAFTVRFDVDDKTYYLVSADGLSEASEDEYGFPVAIGTEKDDTGMTEEEKHEAELAAAERVFEWIKSSPEQAREAESSRAELQISFDREASGTDLTKVSQVYSVENDLSSWNYSFKIAHEIYACHTYNTADGEDSDWFFVKQTGKLNPSKEYHNVGGKKNDNAECYYYVTKYGFTNWPVDSKGSEDIDAIVEGKTSPESTIGSQSVGSSVSRNFSGNVGFNGASMNGGIGFGVSYSSSENFSISDCQIKNDSEASGAADRTAWIYTFSRPISKGGKFKHWYFPDLYDAPLSARSNFQPVNQWIWKVPKTARDAIKGFRCRFDWQTGYSYGAGYAWGIKVTNVSHYDHVSGSPEIYVSFPKYPPLIAANDIKLGKEAQFTPVEMGTCRDWTATSDSSWCRLNMTSGTKDDIGDLTVTVEENGTGADRTAVVTLKTSDGKGYDTFKVLQSYVSKAN